jgi:AcrR family transcriptional regulator
VVDDFVQAAGIARGTFYNHFDDVEELLEATSVWTTNSTVLSIDDAIQDIDDRAVRFGTGIRLFLAKAHSDPVWSRFIARVWKLGPLDPPIRTLEEGLRDGVFRFPDVEVALDVVLGGMREALFAIGTERKPGEYVDRVVQLCLQALGVTQSRIRVVLQRDLPVLASVATPSHPTHRGQRPRRRVSRSSR